ncbi:MAG: hypothetical protein IJM83_09220 [Firmicutes bacterium]|jgi:TM2 domain-containing membrane protein YozV|nr:hypothetical protein [Bacillota bacterium]MBR3394059.1 hypothetical protein [Bacillota bacterium]
MSDQKKLAPVMDDLKGDKLEAGKLMELDYEIQAAERAAGKEERTYGIWGPIWKFMKWREGLKGQHRFKKKTYLWLMLLTGFAGGHRYYQGRWGLGLLYTLFCWTGVPLALCVTDFMEVMPIAADEDGMVVL